MFEVLDYGYIKLIESWGSDERIIEAARMSTDKGFLGWGNKDKPGDEKLLKYLYTNKHMTPFEMAGCIIEVQAPIFVFREWHRHRTQSYNELSARYTPLPDINYVPSIERLLINNSNNKQANSTGTKLSEEDALIFQGSLITSYEYTQDLYESALRVGVPKELARLIIPVGRYSRMRASANLRNWMGFLSLRMDKAAQWEIRQYANALCEILQPLFPKTISLFLGE